MVLGNPAIGADGTIYLCGRAVESNSILFAVNPVGEIKWQLQLADGSISSPIPMEDGTLYASATDDSLYSIDSDGEIRWRFLLDDATSGIPAVGDNGTVFICCADNRVYAVTGDGEEKWRSEALNGTAWDPVVGDDGAVYVTTDCSSLYALKPTGEVYWRCSVEHGANYSGPPPVAIGSDGTVYYGAHDGLHAVRPNGEAKWSFPLPDQAMTPAIDVNGNIYFAADPNSNIYALDSDGGLIWTCEFEYDVNWSFPPVIADDGTLYILRSNDLYAYGPDA